MSQTEGVGDILKPPFWDVCLGQEWNHKSNNQCTLSRRETSDGLQAPNSRINTQKCVRRATKDWPKMIRDLMFLCLRAFQLSKARGFCRKKTDSPSPSQLRQLELPKLIEESGASSSGWLTAGTCGGGARSLCSVRHWVSDPNIRVWQLGSPFPTWTRFQTAKFSDFPTWNILNSSWWSSADDFDNFLATLRLVATTIYIRHERVTCWGT